MVTWAPATNPKFALVDPHDQLTYEQLPITPRNWAELTEDDFKQLVENHLYYRTKKQPQKANTVRYYNISNGSSLEVWNNGWMPGRVFYITDIDPDYIMVWPNSPFYPCMIWKEYKKENIS